MWIQLRSTQNISIAGTMRTYRPGDWVDVGRQYAMSLISSGQAVAYSTEKPGSPVFEIINAGVVVPVGLGEAAKIVTGDLQVYEGAPELHYERTAIYDPTAPVSPALFAVGFSLLDAWELAVPLFDYSTLATHVGTDAERQQTKAIIRDLRVPLYDTRLIFARRTPDAKRLIEKWNSDPGECRMLAFLRALYQVKPLILALPATWTGANYAQ